MNKLLIAGVSVTALSAALYASSVTETLAQDATKSSNLSGFSKVKLSTSSDINISVGSGYSIEIIGDQERINNTILEVKGSTLHVKHKRGHYNYDRDQDMIVYVTMPDIEEMQINGPGDGEITGVDNSKLVLSINGSGDLMVSGKTEKLDIDINGSGDISMDEVDGKNVEISINGSGDVQLGSGSCQSLEIDIHGSGDIDAKDLICEVVEIEVEGSGNSRVHATELLTFNSEGSGKVDVFGKPKKVVDNTRRNSKIRIR